MNFMFTKTILAMKQMQLRDPQTGIILLLLIFQAEVFPGQVRARPGATDEELLELSEGLRLANGCDAPDVAGPPGGGLMAPALEPLWRDLEKFSHIFCGMALTARCRFDRIQDSLSWKCKAARGIVADGDGMAVVPREIVPR